MSTPPAPAVTPFRPALVGIHAVRGVGWLLRCYVPFAPASPMMATGVRRARLAAPPCLKPPTIAYNEPRSSTVQSIVPRGNRPGRVSLGVAIGLGSLIGPRGARSGFADRQ